MAETHSKAEHKLTEDEARWNIIQRHAGEFAAKSILTLVNKVGPKGLRGFIDKAAPLAWFANEYYGIANDGKDKEKHNPFLKGFKDGLIDEAMQDSTKKRFKTIGFGKVPDADEKKAKKKTIAARNRRSTTKNKSAKALSLASKKKSSVQNSKKHKKKVILTEKRHHLGNFLALGLKARSLWNTGVEDYEDLKATGMSDKDALTQAIGSTLAYEGASLAAEKMGIHDFITKKIVQGAKAVKGLSSKAIKTGLPLVKSKSLDVLKGIKGLSQTALIGSNMVVGSAIKTGLNVFEAIRGLGQTAAISGKLALDSAKTIGLGALSAITKSKAFVAIKKLVTHPMTKKIVSMLAKRVAPKLVASLLGGPIGLAISAISLASDLYDLYKWLDEKGYIEILLNWGKGAIDSYVKMAKAEGLEVDSDDLRENVSGKEILSRVPEQKAKAKVIGDSKGASKNAPHAGGLNALAQTLSRVILTVKEKEVTARCVHGKTQSSALARGSSELHISDCVYA